MGYHCGHMGLSPEGQGAGQSSTNSHSSMAKDSSQGHSFFLFKRESFLFLIMCMLAGEVALGDQKRASDPPGAGVKGRCKHPAWVLGAPFPPSSGHSSWHSLQPAPFQLGLLLCASKPQAQKPNGKSKCHAVNSKQAASQAA